MNKKNVKVGDTIEIKKVCKISQGHYNIGDSFKVKAVLKKGVIVELNEMLTDYYIKNKEFRVYPAISESRLNEFQKPLNDYFGNVVKDLDEILNVRNFDLKEVDLNEPILSDMEINPNGVLVMQQDFDTIGIITEDESFFVEKIQSYKNNKLRMFVMIKDEKSAKSHKFAFIILDSKFDERHDLLEICKFNR